MHTLEYKFSKLYSCHISKGLAAGGECSRTP